jgi:flavin reductase (DIM6/NTAB) family NADH-FMN oxidoreductase RutF
VPIPRVADAKWSADCELHASHNVGNATVIYGRVLRALVREDVLANDPARPTAVDFDSLDPASRIGGDGWLMGARDPREDRVRTIPRPRVTEDGRSKKLD